jgi:TetR/AcrR family transcriptional regulator, transcriptional repressor for nem operon
MPRGKTFDPDEKTDEALDLFWRRGCDAVSIQDLVDGLGLNRGSLYDTYGGKEQLWQRALARYCDQRNALLDELLGGPPGPVLPRIRALLYGLTDPETGNPHGCLVVNAITERTNDPATRAMAVGQVNHVEDVLSQALERARDAGEIPATASPRQLARFLVVTIQGLHVLDRATADPARLGDAIAVAMSAISPTVEADQPEA